MIYTREQLLDLMPDSMREAFPACSPQEQADLLDVTREVALKSRFSSSMRATNLNASTGGTGFAARLSTLQAEGKSVGAAILQLRAKDPTGFNAWVSAGRPEGRAPAQITTSTAFAAEISSRMAAGANRGEAILKAAKAHPRGFNSWCQAGRPEGTTGGTGTGLKKRATDGFRVIGG